MGDNHGSNSGHRERLRERFLRGEVSSRTHSALLELLLTFGIPRRDVQPLAEALLARFGDLNQVLAADPSDLRAVDGVEAHVTALLKLVDHIAQARNSGRSSSGPEERPGRVAVPSAPVRPAPEHPEHESATTIPLTQSEMPLEMPGQSELPLVQKEPAVHERRTIQDVLLAEGLLASKVAHEAQSLAGLHEILMKRLGQNSMETRRRYAQSIVRWFFPGGLRVLFRLDEPRADGP